tara:strand:- start:246 stop:920 length:675 start_codon:yes stop_codon:yes gene_type:complete
MEKEQEIIKLLKEKSSTKQKVYRKTKEVFIMLQELLSKKAERLNSLMQKHDKDLDVVYSSRGVFDAQLKFSGETLLFHMHSNIFDFHSEHPIHKTDYVKEDRLRSFCGVIHIYNFLSDSLKYHRLNDEAFLLARIFINKDEHFFVEGEKQLGFMFSDFVNQNIDLNQIENIVNTAMIFALNDDILTPHMKEIQVVHMHQILSMSNNQKIKTAKRLGYRFSHDKK